MDSSLTLLCANTVVQLATSFIRQKSENRPFIDSSTYNQMCSVENTVVIVESRGSVQAGFIYSSLNTSDWCAFAAGGTTHPLPARRTSSEEQRASVWVWQRDADRSDLRAREPDTMTDMLPLRREKPFPQISWVLMGRQLRGVDRPRQSSARSRRHVTPHNVTHLSQTQVTLIA